MNTQRSKCIPGCLNSRKGTIHTKIPKLDLAISTARNQFPKATALHVDVGDPLLMLPPDLDHGRGGLQSLIKHPDRAVSESGHKYVPGHLVRCK